ncbi:unnamed protein product, partial [Allacma fusca]
DSKGSSLPRWFMENNLVTLHDCNVWLPGNQYSLIPCSLNIRKMKPTTLAILVLTLIVAIAVVDAQFRGGYYGGRGGHYGGGGRGHYGGGHYGGGGRGHYGGGRGHYGGGRGHYGGGHYGGGYYGGRG